MWDFSDDEWVAGAVGAAALLFFGWRYYRPLASVSLMGRSIFRRIWLMLFPFVAIVPAIITLSYWSDPRVAGHPDYIALFIVIGLASMFVSVGALAIFGLSFFDDVVDRNNAAALIVACGAMSAVGIVSAGANVGAGTTIWTTLAPAGAGILGLGLVWLVLEIVGHVSELVTINRDVSAALRSAGLLIGCALILGRAAGGNWKSWQQTWNDLLEHSWPVVPMAIIAGVANRILKPTETRVQNDMWSRGVAPAVAFVLAGLCWIVIFLNGLRPWQW